MNSIKELKDIIELDKITSIIYSSPKGDLEYSIPETLKILETTSIQDVPVEMTFNGKDFKIIVSIDDGFKNFSYISLKKKQTMKVVPEVLEPQFWSEKLQRLLPFRDEDYLEKESLEAKKHLKDAIKNIQNKELKLKHRIKEYFNKETVSPEIFSTFEENGNYYIVLPKGIDFDNSVAIFKSPEYSSFVLSKLPKQILSAVDYSGYALFEKDQKPLRIFGGSTLDFSLSKYEEANPELKEATLNYYKEYSQTYKTLISSNFVYPILGISWSNTLNFDESTKELAKLTSNELKKLLSK